MGLLNRGIDLVERGWIPDFLTRPMIRYLCGARVRETAGWDREVQQMEVERFIAGMSRGPIAPVPEKANEQHYEVPADFFAEVLGPHRKYSSCYWETGCTSLEQAEELALQLTCQHADLGDGQDILELGCGWGSLSLWMARHYPHSRITAVSNSIQQKQAIDTLAHSRGIDNLRVVTADMNDFKPDRLFDRIVSVEMFEHMRNYAELLQRIEGWLLPEGKLLIHIFCHKDSPYPFETNGDANWMGKYFFTGGIMPSQDLLCRFQKDLRVMRQWNWNGNHYRKTSDAWLANLDRNRNRVLEILQRTYGKSEGKLWLGRWRIFFLAVAELFGYRNGEEWFVTQTLFEKQSTLVSSPSRNLQSFLKTAPDLIRS